MDNAIRHSSTVAVGLLAAVAGWISYTHALDVCRVYHVPSPELYAYPLTVDGLIYVASMMLLHFAKRDVNGHPKAYAWSMLALGIGVTGAVNAWAGLPYGLGGAIAYAWPAVALVLSYEGLMLLIRNAGTKTAEEPSAVPGVRALMREHKIGYPKARQMRAAMNGGVK